MSSASKGRESNADSSKGAPVGKQQLNRGECSDGELTMSEHTSASGHKICYNRPHSSQVVRDNNDSEVPSTDAVVDGEASAVPDQNKELPRSEDLSNGSESELHGSSKPSSHDEHSRCQHKLSIVDTIASSSSYMDDVVTKACDPHSLYGSFTWKVPNFRDVSKRELKSSAFSVGPYKWYILVYPNGCDVSNHLSLFLCVADYDKLLPGWSHFAQFTIAVVNKDPKKSKYSDTLHRFCKKEHDWGWKKFMELGKMADGFVVGDTLVIKVQVQVIKDRATGPFRTLDSHYRRELIRVYLSNIENIVKRYVEERKQYVEVLLSRGVDKYWNDLKENERKRLSAAPAATLLKLFTKKFFNEKEVTSTLMMDAAYCGMKVLSLAYERQKKYGQRVDDNAESSLNRYLNVLQCNISLNTSQNVFVFESDALIQLEKFARNPTKLYPFDEKSAEPSQSTRSASDNEIESARETAERDELRLIDLARHTLEVFAMSHIAEQNIEKGWMEAEIIRRQEELIREEEEASKDEAQRQAAKAEAERERKARKKERQRAKKEAERLKKEAEEAERAREQEIKKAEQQRRKQEAEERRLQEEARKEAERQRQVEMKQAATAAKKAVRLSKAEVEKLDSSNVGNSLHVEADSMDDCSSALTSARSDHSSNKGSKSKGNASISTPRDTMSNGSHGDLEHLSNQKSLEEEVRRLNLLVQDKDDEINLLKAKVRSLEEEIENVKAKAAQQSRVLGSAPTTPSRQVASSNHATNDEVVSLTQLRSGNVAHQNISGQHYSLGNNRLVTGSFGSVASPSDAILATALTQRVGGVSNESAQGQTQSLETKLHSQAGNGLRVSPQGMNPAQQPAIPPHSQSLNHGGKYSAPSRTLPGYGSTEALLSNKGVAYRQFGGNSSNMSIPGAPNAMASNMVLNQNRSSSIPVSNAMGSKVDTSTNHFVQNNLTVRGGGQHYGSHLAPSQDISKVSTRLMHGMFKSTSLYLIAI